MHHYSACCWLAPRDSPSLTGVTTGCVTRRSCHSKLHVQDAAAGRREHRCRAQSRRMHTLLLLPAAHRRASSRLVQEPQLPQPFCPRAAKSARRVRPGARTRCGGPRPRFNRRLPLPGLARAAGRDGGHDGGGTTKVRLPRFHGRSGSGGGEPRARGAVNCVGWGRLGNNRCGARRGEAAAAVYISLHVWFGFNEITLRILQGTSCGSRCGWRR